MNQLTGVALAVLLMAICPILIYRSSEKQFNKESLECEAEAENWLRDQKLSPYTKVKVITKLGNTYSAGPFYPSAKADYIPLTGWYIDKVTAHDKAMDFVETQVKLDRFKHDDLYIPMCEIESMEILPV